MSQNVGTEGFVVLAAVNATFGGAGLAFLLVGGLRLLPSLLVVLAIVGMGRLVFVGTVA